MNKETQILRKLLEPFTDEYLQQNNIEYARVTNPLNVIPDNLDEEIWETINDDNVQQNRYLISSWGRIFDLKYHDYTSIHISDKGYPKCALSKDETLETKQQYIHRLVAKTFIPRMENKNEVNHIDLDKKNATVNNLEWINNKDNIKHAVESGAFKNRGGHTFFSRETILEIKQKHKDGLTMTDIAKIYGRKYRAISDIINGVTYNDIFWDKMNL
jgi:hypothetical protein